MPAKVNYVPFKGGGEAVAAIIGGHVTAGVSGCREFAQHIKSRQDARARACRRPRRIEGIPSLKEQGVDVELANWRGVLGRARHHQGAARRADRRRSRRRVKSPAGRRRSRSRTGTTSTCRATRSASTSTKRTSASATSSAASASARSNGRVRGPRQAQVAVARRRARRSAPASSGARSTCPTGGGLCAGRPRRRAADRRHRPRCCWASSLPARGVHRRLPRRRRGGRGAPADGLASPSPGSRGGIIAYGLLVERAGFIIASTLLFVMVARGFGSRRWLLNAVVGPRARRRRSSRCSTTAWGSRCRAGVLKPLLP